MKLGESRKENRMHGWMQLLLENKLRKVNHHNISLKLNVHYHHIIAGYIPGLQKVWILGDEFPFRTYEEYFGQWNHKEYNGYTKEYFEIFPFTMSKYASNNRHIISRIKNKIADAIMAQIYLPKLMVFIPDDDFIRCIDVSAKKCSKSL